ncbi:hypothetical protein SPI_04974 [Niveomyces insectorum RCEF 264]|uniref:Uncharacterized protein n=1 Tax=Niveomyces insectorum RCEF 264 TaxID=1081102 RepID=A0A167TU70_9HYPO|nr:hypothetical protein SPI_04974 [Niveomyces insectorum RCEF 264]
MVGTRGVRACWWALLLALLSGLVAANVEKTIFYGPPAVGNATTAVATSLLGHDLVGLFQLAPATTSNTWRTHLPAAFPWAADFPDRATIWVLLDALKPGQLYELHFSLDTFDLETVVSTPALAASVRTYLASLPGPIPLAAAASLATPSSSSFTFLRIVTAANYVTADPALMNPELVPPVLTDIILDPYLLNVVPRSLVPAVVAILAAAAVSWWLSQRILRWLRRVAVGEDDSGGSFITQDKKGQ